MIGQDLTPILYTAVRVTVFVFCLLHLLFAFVTWRQTSGAQSQVSNGFGRVLVFINMANVIFALLVMVVSVAII